MLVGALASLDNIGDTGSSSVMPRDVVTVAEGMEAGGFTVSRADSINEDNEGQVAGADVVVVVVGLTADDEGEATIGAGDRESLSLSDEDEALIAQAASLNDLVVVILNGGAAIVVESWIDSVEAVVFAFYPGQEGGHALADLFSGRANFSGRLPFSVPVSEAELPPFDNTSDVVSYGFLHGYRFLDANDTPARFPFGYGLSYGAVRYDSLELGSVEVAADETLEVRVRLTNEGDSSVIETVQLYVASAASSVIRAPQDLRAFTQLSLEPGASGEALLRVPLSRVAFWDEEESAWVVEPTEYEVRVGPHAASTPLRATFAVVEK